jgi:NADPH:quinone reductase-like Zn-dependent oxidoreductase
MNLVRSLGADAVIDHTTRDFTRDGQTYAVICDVLGKAGFPRSVRALAPRGRYLMIGFPDGVPAIAAALLRGLWLHVRGRRAFRSSKSDRPLHPPYDTSPGRPFPSR